jgi:hypothetical protein
LRLADVKRTELFASDAARKAMTFYDLRATGITWMAVRGDDPLRIKQRAGHRIFSTTEGYIREAENLREGNFGEPFPPLPIGLYRSKERSKSEVGRTVVPVIIQEKSVEAPGIERLERHSRKPRRDAALTRNSRGSFGKPFPFAPGASRLVPGVGA